ncbi:MAG: magnesium/cobalt transporter CorA [Planctomycetes bacterium]|nr:magnesium/cobalt transporter CorA [Planctomycetota bacterium]
MTATPSPVPSPDDRRPKRLRKKRAASPVGASPGTLQPGPDALPMAMSVVGYGRSGVVEKQAPTLAEIAAMRGSCAVVWVDVTGIGDVAMLRALGEEFGLHRLALEDVVNVHQRAKVEDFGDHAFVVLRMVDATHTTETEQFSIFVGENFVLTFQERPGDCFAMVRNRLRDPAGQMQRRGADYLAYALLDAVVDAFFPELERLDARLEAIELSILDRKVENGTVEQLHGVRRCLLELRRAVWPLREVAGSLLRGDSRHFSHDVQPYLRDVHDHVVQLLDLLENYREMTSSLLDLHLSTVNHRLNEVMKLLTVISTIFIPLTFVAGIYGMNFDWMPELRVWWGYPVCLGVMLVTGLCMLRWFKQRGWV